MWPLPSHTNRSILITWIQIVIVYIIGLSLEGWIRERLDSNIILPLVSALCDASTIRQLNTSLQQLTLRGQNRDTLINVIHPVRIVHISANASE